MIVSALKMLPNFVIKHLMGIKLRYNKSNREDVIMNRGGGHGYCLKVHCSTFQIVPTDIFTINGQGLGKILGKFSRGGWVGQIYVWHVIAYHEGIVPALQSSTWLLPVDECRLSGRPWPFPVRWFSLLALVCGPVLFPLSVRFLLGFRVRLR